MPISSLFTSPGAGVGPKVREIKARDRERFFFFMGMMLKSGQTTIDALRAVARMFKKEGKEEIAAGLTSIAQKSAQGRSLSKSMEGEPVMFSDIHRAAIMAGETSNRMQESFEILRTLENKAIESARGGFAELMTPGLMLILSSVSLFNTGLNTLPVMENLKKAQGDQMGILPQAIMAFTHGIANNWYLIIAAFVMIGVLIYSMVKSTQGRFWLDTYTLKLPGIGNYIAYKTYASMLLYFPHMVESGVKPKQMIPIMETLATNQVLKRKIDGFNQVITTGGSMSEAMDKAGFPSIAVTPVAVSENYAGSDDGVNDVMIEGMHHAHHIIDRMLEDTQKRFISTASTILWLCGGGIMMMEMLSIVLSQN